ncbi:MAG TPA: glycosyltransferase family 39 protein [Anaerolineales bacterium]
MPETEPSVLDYLKSLLPWSRHPIEIPAPVRETAIPAPAPAAAQPPLPIPAPPESAMQVPAVVPVPRPRAATAPMTLAAPWRSLLALGAALLAQSFFEPPQTAGLGVAFYILAAVSLAWAAIRQEWTLAPRAEAVSANDPLTVRWIPFVVSAILLVPVFILLGGAVISPGAQLPPWLASALNLQDNLFTWYSFSLWLLTVGLFVWSLWLGNAGAPALWGRLRSFLGQRSWQIRIDGRILMVLAVVAVVVFFRVYHLQQTPAEPFSDHAEKILDVFDISQGKTHIFFPRNTGREGFQMYWTLLMSWIFGTGLTFLTLKIGTIAIGLLTLPFIYLLGKEVAGQRVGLLAFLLAGIGYWPNVIARIGLRFPLYPMFVAPMMFFLVRGLRTRRRNDFILSGIFLGLGLHGYSPFRIVPFLVVLAILLYVLHAQSKGARQDAVLWLVITGLASFLVFLPLLRYAAANPDMFSYRALTRLGSVEQPLPAPVGTILLSNTWNGIRMFNWNDGVIWVHSVPNRPALDIVTGALFLIGVVLLLVRYIRERHWLDLFLLSSVAVLVLPSILSLAFPDENPSLNRTAGAIVPVFVIAALALDGLIRLLLSKSGSRFWAYTLPGVLLLWTGAQNFDLVFHQFDQQFRNNAWNTSDMGVLIEQFRAQFGETDTVWIVPFPYWVDTRLPGIYAGIPNRDFAMWPDQLSQTVPVAGPKLFMVKANLQDPSQNDQKSLDLLKQLYPQGTRTLQRSPIPNHDFWTFFVPASASP